MSKLVLYKIFDNSAKVKQIVDSLQQTDPKIQLNGLIGSSLSFVVQSLFKKLETEAKPNRMQLNPFYDLERHGRSGASTASSILVNKEK